MNAVTATRRTIRREWTAWGTLLILSVGLMGVSDTSFAHDLQSSVNWAVSPAETVINDAADTAGSYWSALTQIDRLRTENEKLRTENQTLKEQLARQPAISKLNDDWTKITAEGLSVPYRTAAARVIVRDIGVGRTRTIIINKGTSDGVQPGQTVIDAGGALVGRIMSPNSATVSVVLLLNDTTAVVAGKEIKTGATGTIRGSVDAGTLEMSYVNKAATLDKGEAIVTAGEALTGTSDRSPYPPGLLIGTVTSVSKDPNEVFKSAQVKPAADLENATFLLVILDYQGGFDIPGLSPAPGSAKPSGSVKPTAKPTPTPAY